MAALAQEVPPAERQQAPVHLFQHLVEIGDRDRHADHLAGVFALGDHEPVLVEGKLQLLGEGVEILLGVRHEVPVLRPRCVVDLAEELHVFAQLAAAHRAHADPVLALRLVGELPDHRQHPVAFGDLQFPHQQVHRLAHPRLLQQPLVVGRVPRLVDHRAHVEALDQDAALVVHREVGGPDHLLAAALPQPRLCGVEQCLEDLAVLLELQEAEPAPLGVVLGVEGVVDLRGDPADHAPARRARKYSASPWLKKAFMRRLRKMRRSSFSGGTHSGWLACRRKGRSMNRFRSLPPATGLTSTLTATAPYTQRARDHMAIGTNQPPTAGESQQPPRTSSPRPATTSAPRSSPPAREAGILPYFHVLTSPAMPVVEMEGAQRIMLGSNNYLGLTGDERVIAGAQDALHRYGTGLTGSRPLNGTTPLHLELEARDRRVDGQRGRARVHHRAPGQPRYARHDPRRRATP